MINTNRYGLREAFEMGLIERDVIPDLELGYNAILGFPSKNGAMTIMEACRLEKISEQDAVRMLHVQVFSLPVDFLPTFGIILATSGEVRTASSLFLLVK